MMISDTYSVASFVSRAISLIDAVWQFLTKPHSAIQEPEHRRRARLLAVLLLAMVPLAITGVVTYMLAEESNPFASLTFYIALFVVGGMAIGYVLSRTRHYVWAASVTVGVLTLSTIVASSSDINNVSLVNYLSLCVLLSSMLLPVRGTVVVSVACLSGLVLLPNFLPELSSTSYIDLLVFDVITFATVTIAALVRHLDLRQIEQQARELSNLFHRAEQNAAELGMIKVRLEAILNSVGDALMVIGLDGSIERVNPAFEEQCGYTAEEVHMRHHEELVLSNQMSRASIQDAEDAMKAEQVWRGETRIQRKDGTTYAADVTIAPVRDHTGEVISFVAIIRDVTALKELERMKDAFVSNVSHELRTPIANLKLHLSLIEKTGPDRFGAHLDTMRRETERLRSIIEDVLRLSRLEQRKVELNLEPVDLNALTRQYVDDRIPLAKSRGLTLKAIGEERLPLIVADASLLGQTLSVLLTNALNYTFDGGQVVVTTHGREREGAQWAGFSVMDTGPGIPPDEQEQLFQRFFRGSVGRASIEGGTGLGLAIAKEIVDRHGGYIEVDSEGVPGQGSTFSVWLPALDST